MNIKSEDVVERLTALGYSLEEGDTLSLQFVISDVEQYIKNFCNIKEIPEELYCVAVDMAAGKLLKAKQAIGTNVCEGVDFENDNIKQIAEGDVSITYNSDSSNSATARYNALIDSLCNRDSELLAFRRLRW